MRRRIREVARTDAPRPQLAGEKRVTRPTNDGVEAIAPDMPVVRRTWGARSDDHWYRAEVELMEIGMAVAPAASRFDFRGPGPLHPDEVRAGMNGRIGRAGLQVTRVILHEIDRVTYSDLGPTRRD